MPGTLKNAGLAVAITAAANLALLVIIAWVLAVSRGLGASRRSLAPLAIPAAEPVSLVITAEKAEEKAGTPPEETKKFVLSPDTVPEAAPDKASDFLSDRSMRAASEMDAVRDGIRGMATSRGDDIPSLDLSDATFRDGGEKGRPGTEQNAATGADGPPEPTPLQPETSPAPPAEKRQPDPRRIANLLTPPDSPAPEAPASDRPPESQNEAQPMPGTVAFRDDTSPTLIPDQKPAPKPQTSPPPASTPPPATAARAATDGSYSAETRRALKAGTISNKGQEAVDALATEEGKYGKAIRAAIEKSWRRRMLNVSGLANPGLVEVEFEVDARGRIFNVKLTNPGEANPVMQDCALSAVIDARLPPPPPALLRSLEDKLTGGRFPCNFSFLIY